MHSRPFTLAQLAPLFVSLFSFAAIAQPNNSIKLLRPSIEELASLPLITGIAVSPDGASFAYVADGNLFVAGLRSNVHPRRISTGSRPRWSPDSHRLGFYCAREQEQQLCMFDRASGIVHQITRLTGGILRDGGIDADGGGALADFDWSDDSRLLAFSAKPPAIPDTTKDEKQDRAQALVFVGEADRDPLVQHPGFPANSIWGGCGSRRTPNFTSGRPCGYSQLYIADVATGRVRQVTFNHAQHFHPVWSTDSAFLWFIRAAGTPRNRLGMPSTQLVKLDLRSGSENAVEVGSRAKIRPSRSPNGALIAFKEGGDSQYLPWSLVVINSKGSEVVDTRAIIDRNVIDFQWCADSRHIVLIVRDGVREQLVLLDIADLAVRHLQLGTNWITLFGLSRNNTIVFVSEGANTVNNIAEADAFGEHTRPLLQLSPEVAGWRLGEQSIITWQNSNGERLEGVLVMPTDRKTAGPYPLIVDMRGTLSCDCFQRDRWDANQLLAQNGYAVFYPVLRPIHYPLWFTFGDDFHQYVGVQEGTRRSVDDLTTGVVELIRLGVASRGSIGLMGFSVGGYGALQMAAHSNLFSSVVAAGTVYGDWSRDYLLWSDSTDLRSRIGGRRLWDDPDAYREMSLVYNLNHITAPTLLLVGDLDSQSFEENVEMYNGLRELGTPVTLIRYPNQGHQIEGADLRDYWTRVIEHCDRYLKHAE